MPTKTPTIIPNTINVALYNSKTDSSKNNATISMVEDYFSYFQARLTDLSNRANTSDIINAADILYRAKDIHVYGQYSASHAKQQLQVDLSYSGKYVICYCSIDEMINDSKKLTADSAVIVQIIASYKNYSSCLPVIKEILSRNIPTIIITSTTTLNNFKEADCILTFSGTDTAMDNYFIDVFFNLMSITYRTKYID